MSALIFDNDKRLRGILNDSDKGFDGSSRTIN